MVLSAVGWGGCQLAACTTAAAAAAAGQPGGAAESPPAAAAPMMHLPPLCSLQSDCCARGAISTRTQPVQGMSKRKGEDPAALDLPKKAKMDNGAEGETLIDENLHSRQLAVYGREVMRRMAASSVLISGLNGVGVEIGEGVCQALGRRMHADRAAARPARPPSRGAVPAAAAGTHEPQRPAEAPSRCPSQPRTSSWPACAP